MPRGCHIRCHPRASPDHTSTERCTTPKPSRFNINLFAFPRHVVAVAQGPRTHCFVSSVWNTAEDPIYLSFVTALQQTKVVLFNRARALLSQWMYAYGQTNRCKGLAGPRSGSKGAQDTDEKPCAEGARLRLSCPFPLTNTPQLQS